MDADGVEIRASAVPVKYVGVWLDPDAEDVFATSPGCKVNFGF